MALITPDDSRIKIDGFTTKSVHFSFHLTHEDE